MNKAATKVLVVISILTASSLVEAQDSDTTTVKGHTDICVRVDAHTVQCTRIERGKKPESFTVTNK